ncbi:MAG: hypothetical protein IJ043_09790 [Clostridia bacterium]|nr:hypothetical protein [Clostridia bacterium]
MRTDEQFKAAVLERCARRKKARRRVQAAVCGSCLTLLIAGMILFLPPSPEKPAAGEMRIEILSPYDGETVWLTLTDPAAVTALVEALPAQPSQPEEQEDQTKNNSTADQIAEGYILAVIDPEGNRREYLITDYPALRREGQQLILWKDAASLNTLLKEYTDED